MITKNDLIICDYFMKLDFMSRNIHLNMYSYEQKMEAFFQKYYLSILEKLMN